MSDVKNQTKRLALRMDLIKFLHFECNIYSHTFQGTATLTSFWTVYRVFSALTRAVGYALLGVHAARVLIGGWNPMLCQFGASGHDVDDSKNRQKKTRFGPKIAMYGPKT